MAALGSIVGATVALLVLGASFYGLLSLVPRLRTDKLVLAVFLALGVAIVLAAFGMATAAPRIGGERSPPTSSPAACLW